MNYKERYDIFICGGSQHFDQLKNLLPQLYPFGRLHLASITLTEQQVAELSAGFDHLHTPNHDPDGYINFNLFCIRDINRLATAPHFIKLDADVTLREDWIEYVNHGLRQHNQAVLFGVKEGLARVDVQIAGSLARQRFGQEICVVGGRKVIGGFYVGATAFFRRHDEFMQDVHDLLYCFGDGKRHRPHPGPDRQRAFFDSDDESFTLSGNVRDLQRIGNEDTLRNLIVHARGASDRLFVLDSEGSIQFPHGPQ